LAKQYIFNIAATGYISKDNVAINVVADLMVQNFTISLNILPILMIKVLNNLNKPISNAKLSSDQLSSLITNQDGDIVLEHCLPDQYVFNISADGYLSKDNVAINVLADIMVQNFTISLNILPSLMIKVVDKLLNKPISNAKFSCSQLSPLTTNKDGNISVERCLPDQYIFLIL
jgi:catabolite regulation protein CreA